MFKTLFLSFVALISSWVNPVVSSLRGGEADAAIHPQSQVLASTTSFTPNVAEGEVGQVSNSQVIFTVNVPARFLQGITAPNLLYSITNGNGISLNNTDPQNPILTNTGVLSLNKQTGNLTLSSGDGISITTTDNTLQIKNTGILSLSAGDGINVDGNKITNSGILSLSAGEGISIDGNKITNTMPTPDYTLSGWTDEGTTVRLTTPSDSVTLDNLTTNNFFLANNYSILPSTDLGSDLGSSSYRFNNLYVSNLYSNHSQTFSGQSIFSYSPQDITLTEGSVIINPTTSSPSGQLLALGLAGYQRALLDAEGDLTLGYSGNTSAPASSYPLNIYGHNSSLVSYIDTNGNLTMGNTLTPLSGLLSLSGGLNTTGNLNINSGKFFVNSSTGYIGVGTTSPSQLFTVSGNTDSLSSYVQNLINRTASNTSINFGTNQDTISLISGGNTAVHLNSSGQVGIGTTSTGGSQLRVQGTTNLTGAATLDSTLNVTGNTTLTNTSLTSATISSTLTTTGLASFLSYLGIGTTNPTSQLDINTTTTTDALRFTNTLGNKLLAMASLTNGISLDIGSTDPTNLITNGTFESNTSSWTGTQTYSLNDEFTDTLPTTLYNTTPSAPVPTLGSELVTNGNMSSSTGWNTASYTPNTFVVSDGVATNGAPVTSTMSQNILTLSHWYFASADIVMTTPGAARIYLGSSSQMQYATGGTKYYSSRSSGDNLYYLQGDAGFRGTFDNASVKELTLSTLFNSVNVSASTDYTVQADVTLTPGTQAGIVMNLNSDTSPTNFVLAYHDGTNAHLEKGVGGTYTSLINTAATYVPGATIKVIKNGTSYSLFYNGTQVSTTQTISDAGIISNTRHGLFSTYSTNSFANFSIKGGVNQTLATDGVNTRTVTDTLGKLTTTGGQASLTTGSAGGTSLSYPTVTRATGKVITGTITPNSTGGELGFLNSVKIWSQQIGGNGYRYDGTAYNGTEYKLAQVFRTAGNYLFIKGGTYTNWTLLNFDNTSSATPLSVRVAADQSPTSMTFVADNIRIPTATFLPTPLAYDTFTGVGTTATETVGPDSQTTPSLNWTNGTKSGGVMKITPTLGSELVTNGDMSSSTGWTVANPPWSIGSGVATSNGTAGELSQSIMTVGNWYQSISTLSRTSGNFLFVFGGQNGVLRSSSGTFTETGRQTSTGLARFYSDYYNGTLDNASVKPLTLSSLFSTVSTSDSDVIADVGIGMTAGTQAGLVLNLDSTSNPQNFVLAYHDGTNVKLEKGVGGTYTTVQTTAVTYVAGATLRVIKDATKYRVYYNNALVGSEQTISDAGIISNTIHGLFSTYSGNTFDNFTLFARGTGNEYAQLTPDDLTVTRDTTTKFANSTASVKLIAGSTDNDFTQNINIGNTATYTLNTYAYTNGTPVSSTDLSLYYGSSPLTTTYTPFGGSGWYKLTATLTGIASSQPVGVRIKAGKTVYLDNITLTSGTAATSTMYVYNTSTGKANLNVQGLIDGTLGGMATFSKSGTISDSDFSSPTNGLLAVDSLNHRLYYREGGSWSYIARTGGFQIPKEESTNFSPGDILLPYVESRLSDGALHGLYTSFNDIFLSGVVTVPKDTTSLRVLFPKPFLETPIINLTSYSSEGRIATITDIGLTGFTITLDHYAFNDYTYSWKALLVPGAKETKSSTPFSNLMQNIQTEN